MAEGFTSPAATPSAGGAPARPYLRRQRCVSERPRRARTSLPERRRSDTPPSSWWAPSEHLHLTHVGGAARPPGGAAARSPRGVCGSDRPSQGPGPTFRPQTPASSRPHRWRRSTGSGPHLAAAARARSGLMCRTTTKSSDLLEGVRGAHAVRTRRLPLTDARLSQSATHTPLPPPVGGRREGAGLPLAAVSAAASGCRGDAKPPAEGRGPLTAAALSALLKATQLEKRNRLRATLVLFRNSTIFI